MKTNDPEKIEWQGTIVSIQPRTSVWRYRLDNRTHYHRGYNLFLDGEANEIKTQFSVAVSEKQQQKMFFRIGDVVKGSAWTKMYEVSDYADYYRAGGLKIIKKAGLTETTPPPYLIEPPNMATYEERGARMLSASSYKGKCFQCHANCIEWGSPVPCLTKTAVRFMTKGGWTIFAQKGVVKTINHIAGKR